MDYVSYNGEISKKPQIPLDQGFLYGYGVFETINVAQGKLVFFEDHMERFKQSALVMGLKLTIHPDQIRSECQQIIDKNAMIRGGLRVTLSKGLTADNLLITARENHYDRRMFEQGVKICTADTIRNEKSRLVSIKSNNYLENLLILNEAKALGFSEAVFYNTQGHLAEGCMTNIFLIKNGQVGTPARDCGLLAGIVRNRVIDLLKTNQIPIAEGYYSSDCLLAADEVFITNSLMEIMPVKQLDKRCYGVGPETLTARIDGLFQQAWGQR
ncbi:aminotransferase class IV [Acetobacterium sp. UBA5834]|jgi:4-amino-4-deoxychorismate lyase|uniref:aminotransferase class IV n=1 Tax=Acetobacterium sp. UBA5834 TaxID=1945907 RepID=UPI00257E9C68|nr:aminotransferase class IV [Acetobacterium sp. UBA5834]